MSTTTTIPATDVKAQAADIVASGKDVQSRLTKVVAQNATSNEPGGLIGLTETVIAGAREGFARAVPRDPDNVLRQVVDALGDGLSQMALAAQLACQETTTSARRFANDDLVRWRKDLAAACDTFVDTVTRGLSAGKALTKEQLSNAQTHARRTAEELRPRVQQALEVVEQHPFTIAQESVRAGVSAAQAAAGSLSEALGHMLERAGERLQRERRG